MSVVRRKAPLASVDLRMHRRQSAWEQLDDAGVTALPWSPPLPARTPAPGQTLSGTRVPAAVRNLVLARDCYVCVCCGKSVTGEMSVIHFRKPERDGGQATPENLITVLPACGERISYGGDPQDETWGYRLQPWDDPEFVPIVLALAGPRPTVWLTPDGLLSFESP